MSQRYRRFNLSSLALRLAGLVVVLLSAQLAVHAATPPARDPTREIFELSSIRPQLQLVGYQVDEWVMSQSAGVSPAHLDVLRTQIARMYSSASLESEIVPRMRARLDRAHAAKAVSWLRSVLGRRVNACDTEAASAAGVERIHLYVNEVRQNPPPADRMKLVERAIKALRYTDNTIELGLALVQGLVLGIQAVGPAELRDDPQVVRSKIASTREAAFAEGRGMSVASLLYTYRTLSISELAGFVEFAESDAGRWYHEAVWGSTQEALAAVALKLQQQVVAEIESLEAPSAPASN